MANGIKNFGDKEGYGWNYMTVTMKTKQFRWSVDWLLKCFKLKRGLYRDNVIAEFSVWLEEVVGDKVSAEALYAYLRGRANFPFEVALDFLDFLADYENGKRAEYPETIEFVNPYLVRFKQIIDKFELIKKNKADKLQRQIDELEKQRKSLDN